MTAVRTLTTRHLLPAIVLPVLLAGAAADARAQGGPREGIKVIGEWTIVVRDEAGREVHRSEFHNSLIDQGKSTLASLLSRGRAISQWAILLTNSSTAFANGRQPCGDATTDVGCALVEQSGAPLGFVDVSTVPGLAVGVDPADSSKLRLAGSTKATNDSFITTVSTLLSLCPAGPPSPTGCPSTQQFQYLSGTQNFTNPPQVVKGQTIDVTVTFSFQ